MTETNGVTLPALKFLLGESPYICRLCFGDSDGGVCLDESRLVQGCYYDDTVTFEDMLKDLGATNDSSLPRMLCEYCADLTINSFLFQKLCQLSFNKWQDTLENFNKTLDMTDTLSPAVKTAYMVIQNENSLILTSRKLHKNKNKEVALAKIQDLMKARRYKKVKKMFALVCEECGEKFSSSNRLTRHMKRMHRNKKYPCTQCPKIFLSITHLHAHLERIHRPKTIQCPKCTKMFSTEKMLKVHDATNHKAAICKRCFVQFPSQKDLRQHLNRHDINKCPRCDKEFVHKHTFNTHLKLCGNDEERQLKFCDICNKGYTHKNGLRSHLVAKHGFGQVFRCKWCKKPFDAMSKLKYHIVKHTRERNFHCDKCGGQFVTHAALIYHIRLHTGEKPFPCDMCEESFLSASRRMEHKKRKHWGPNRECTFCHSKFVTGHELQKHMARHKNPQSRLFVAENEAEINNSTRKRKIMYF